MSSSPSSSVSVEETQNQEEAQQSSDGSFAARSVATSYITFFTLANLVIGFCSITIPSFLVPLQVLAIPALARAATFEDSLIIGLGGVAACIAMLFVGGFADTRYGRVWSFVLGGVCVLVGYALLGGLLGSVNLFVLCLGSILSSFGGATSLVTLLARLPEFSLGVRGKIAALISMAPLTGNLIGQILVNGKQPDSAAILLGGVSLVIFVLYVLSDLLWTQRHPFVAPSGERQQLLSTLRRLPLYVNRDFLITWISRCLILLLLTTASTYILFYLLSVLHETTSQALYFLCFTVTLAISAIVNGIISDRLQRRRVIAVSGAVVVTVALVLLAADGAFHSLPLMLIAAAIFGIGMGMYLACDLALTTLVLPDVARHGEGMAIMNIATYVPVIIAPMLGALVIAIYPSYPVLFAVLAVLAIVAAITLSFVKVK